ncbi:OmpH family outer membrane protein [Sporomusa acidovorans]|uniref:Outer membrane protein (OmpH-like) n=1 Tax=Sporomusa acidovorans (strain ATCC 49682 / DSM 3132 / Mol) TaxID=1123286 RepID=A0ABZ3J7W1_SPOA4|nr:OmpH family outer membrane protein [Sporomusa acidovorans]OZC19287.1 outer membrane protein (OmpH-like) [Sporomusa acidovorans DSM 3132]SDD81875.1 periplasmic chaperone for outer membrane proteins Skp [Sporomusa acidovorans]
MNRQVRMSLVLVLIFIAGLALAGCSSQATIGVLDVNKVMSDSPKIKQFQDQLNAKGKELSDQLEKDKPNISQEEFQKRQEAAYGDFLKTKQDLESQIDANIKQAIEEVSKEKKLGVVLYKNSVASGGTDVTDAVIQKMQ